MQITLTLPDELMARAKAEGLLEEGRLAQMIENELNRAQATRQFAGMTRALRSVEPALTEAEIQAELDARKAERMSSRAGDVS